MSVKGIDLSFCLIGLGLAPHQGYVCVPIPHANGAPGGVAVPCDSIRLKSGLAKFSGADKKGPSEG